MAESPASTAGGAVPEEETRRDFLYLATGAVGTVGVLAAVWPLVHQMNPSADVLALSTTEVDLSGIDEGQSITVVWRGKPVFVRHRTAAEITAVAGKHPVDAAEPGEIACVGLRERRLAALRMASFEAGVDAAMAGMRADIEAPHGRQAWQR